MRTLVPVLLIGCSNAQSAPPTCFQDNAWTQWAPGLDFGVFQHKVATPVGDGRIRVLRVDPGRWRTDLHTARTIHDTRKAADWADHTGAVAITNAGMFATDMTTHVGSLTINGHERGLPNTTYHSVATFESTRGGPHFDIVDTDRQKVEPDRWGYTLQNLRLIRSPGESRWANRTKMWSEAALAKDAEGRAWWVFTRSPWTMRDLNAALIGLGAVAAQHLEGGPEAQLHVSAGGCSFSHFGSYETGFVENDGNDFAWRIPNVLALSPRVPAAN